MDESPDLLETLALARDFLSREIAYAPASVARMDDRESDADPLTILSQEACTCQKCGLAQTRTSVVFGSGNTNADLIFVGEAPGAEEDQAGIAFCGGGWTIVDAHDRSHGFDARRRLYRQHHQMQAPQ